MELTNAALVDCTVGPTIVDAYPAFIDANLHIITPNKWANALPWTRYAALMELLERRKRHFLFEANVGAGLPVVSTLRDLIASGDEIVRIEGILSGTLSYLFNTFDGSTPFSALVADAHRMGFTEPGLGSRRHFRLVSLRLRCARSMPTMPACRRPRSSNSLGFFRQARLEVCEHRRPCLLVAVS